MSKLFALTAKSRNTPPGAVRFELSRILQSEGFIHSGRMRRFLEFVVEEALAGRASQLCEYSIAVSVFDRAESFEPGLDPIVRNDARRLRNKLLEYYQRTQGSRSNQILIEIPKGGYAPLFSLASAPAREGSEAPYRLFVTLVRVADGREMLSQCYDLQDESLSVGVRIGNRDGTPRVVRYQDPVRSISEPA